MSKPDDMCPVLSFETLAKYLNCSRRKLATTLIQLAKGEYVVEVARDTWVRTERVKVVKLLGGVAWLGDDPQ